MPDDMSAEARLLAEAVRGLRCDDDGIWIDFVTPVLERALRAAEARGREQAAKIAECPRYKDGALAAKDSDYYRYGQHIAAAIRALAR